MPILKAIAGHGGTAGIRRYLEKGNRALARDVMNLPMEEWVGEAPGEHSIFVDWDVEMDRTREAYGTNTPWRGLDARTFEHFVISPDPEDGIDLNALRRLSRAWTERHFKDFEVAIVYHDDNERGIPHAHVVVNNANLKTGYRCHISKPETLNQELQDMAREMGLSGLSNVMPKRGSKERKLEPRSRQAVYFGRAEREIMRSGGYSWVGDIRARVALAKNTCRTEGEFRTALAKLGISIEDNSEIRAGRRSDQARVRRASRLHLRETDAAQPLRAPRGVHPRSPHCFTDSPESCKRSGAKRPRRPVKALRRAGNVREVQREESGRFRSEALDPAASRKRGRRGLQEADRGAVVRNGERPHAAR